MASWQEVEEMDLFRRQRAQSRGKSELQSLALRHRTAQAAHRRPMLAQFAVALLVGLIGVLTLAVGSSAQSGPPTVSGVRIVQPVAGSPAALTFQTQGATSTSCQWQKNDNGASGPSGTWADISGATSCSAYTPPSGDSSYWYRARVIATNANGSTTAHSPAIRVGGEVLGDQGCSGLVKAFANGSIAFISAGPSPPPCPHEPSASPDGKLIAYTSSQDGGDIYLTDSRGAWKRQLTSGVAQDMNPEFSPDGTRIAFQRRQSGVDSINTVDPVSGSIVTVTSLANGGLEAIRFSFAAIGWYGNEIAYARTGLDTGQPGGKLWRHWWQRNNSTGEVTTGKTVDDPPCPYNGGDVIFLRCDFRYELWAGDTQLTDTPAPTSEADWNYHHGYKIGTSYVSPSPDASKVLYSSLHNGKLMVFDGSSETYTNDDIVITTWRDDGQKVFYTVLGAGSNSGVWIMNSDLSGKTPYAVGGFTFIVTDFAYLDPEGSSPTIMTTSLPGGTTNQAYSQLVTATSGTAPYSWAILAGALPPGLSLTATGTPSATISGTPTTAGTYNFTVQVSDSANPVTTDTQDLSIVVAPPPPTITTTSLTSAVVGQGYSQPVTATNGTTPYSWTVSAGVLPPGLNLAPTGTPSATISGTPTTAGTYNFTARVTDSASATDTQALSIIVAAPPPVPNPQVLDNFNRTPSENPVSQGGNWAPTGINGGPGAPHSQNRLRNFPSPNGGYSYRVTPYLGGDMEAAATVVTRPNTNHWLSVFICLQQAGTSGWDGYELRAKVLSGPDLWEIRRVDNGSSTILGSFNFEIAANGTMLLRRWGGALQFWWKPSGGAWSQKLTVSDSAYMWGMIGAGGYSSGALDDFGGGSLLTLLDQYAPELRYYGAETYRADAADIATKLWHPTPYRTNELKHLAGDAYAAADPDSPLDNLSLDYLSTQAFPFDYLSQPDWYLDDVEQAAFDYTEWVALHPEHRQKAYGRVVPDPGGSGQKILQYWLYYYYNSKNMSGIGKHEGDWEFYQARLDAKDVPMSVALSQHGNGEKCDWGPDVELATSGRPAVYVAYESHANYFWAGTHSRPFPLPDDVTQDAGAQYREIPTASVVTSPPGWIMWNGRWGDSTGEDTSSPKSPGAETSQWDAWAFHANAGTCTEPPPSPLSLRMQAPSVSETLANEGTPPLARIKEVRLVRTKLGKALRVAYCFGSMPSDSSRRPSRIHVTVENRTDGLPPLSVGWRVTRRCGTITHHVGPIKPPYVFSYAVESRSGTWSKRAPIRLS